jgi:hypothetical protein
MSTSKEHAARLREMIYDLACFGLDASGSAALLAGAEALEAVEVAESERNVNTDTVRAMGPHFCDFVFGGPGAADYL